MRYLNCTLVLLITFSTPAFVGCGDPAPTGGDNGSENGDDDHHGEKGPRGGHLIELGRDHSFHAELVDDHDAGTISIYIMDKDLKDYPIGESKITLVLNVHGTSETFELHASGAVDGKTARFDAADKKLHEELEAHEETEGKLRVTIDGTPYTGMLKHEDHDGEDHKGHNH